MKKVIIISIVIVVAAIYYLSRTDSLPGNFFRAYLGNIDDLHKVTYYYLENGEKDLAEKWAKKTDKKLRPEHRYAYSYVLTENGKLDEAVKVLKESVENGCIECGYRLSRAFAYGYLLDNLIPDAKIKVSPEQCYKWAIKTAEIVPKDHEKETILYSLYACADIGFKMKGENLIYAKKCCDKAKTLPFFKDGKKVLVNDINYISAMIDMSGGEGIEQNQKNGVDYLINYVENIKDAKRFHFNSIIEVINLYYKGVGVPKDIEKAKKVAEKFNLNVVIEHLEKMEKEIEYKD